MSKNYNTDIPGWMLENELKILSTLASFVPENGSILEIGCFLGRSTTALYRGKSSTVSLDVIDNFSYGPLNGTVEDVKLARCNLDLWNQSKLIYETGGWKEAFRFCIGEEMYSNINLHVINSKDFIKEKKYNLTFIDGSHLYENVLHDIQKFITTEDLLIGDDFHALFPGVLLALNKVRQKYERTLIVFEQTKIWALVPAKGYWKDVFKNNNLLFFD